MLRETGNNYWQVYIDVDVQRRASECWEWTETRSGRTRFDLASVCFGADVCLS